MYYHKHSLSGGLRFHFYNVNKHPTIICLSFDIEASVLHQGPAQMPASHTEIFLGQKSNFGIPDEKRYTCVLWTSLFVLRIY